MEKSVKVLRNLTCIRDCYYHGRLIYPDQKIYNSIVKVADNIKDNYFVTNHKNFPIVLIGILNGCIPFFAEFMKQLDINCEIDFCKINSWGEHTSHNERDKLIQIERRPTINVEGKYVLIVDDIMDTGGAIDVMYKWAYANKAAIVESVVLLDKPANRIATDNNGQLLTPTYAAIKNVPNKFLYGFGLDLKGHCRHFQDIFVLEETTDKELFETCIQHGKVVDYFDGAVPDFIK